MVEACAPEWSAKQKAILLSDFAKTPAAELEKFPIRFFYEFQSDDVRRNGTTCPARLGNRTGLSRLKYGEGWEAIFRKQIQRNVIENNDMHLFVGTRTSQELDYRGLFHPSAIAEAPQGDFFKGVNMAKGEFALYAWTDEDDPNSVAGSYQETDVPDLEKLKRRAQELIASGKYKFVGIWGWDEADQCYQNEPIAEYP